ncbi:MAG: DNA repair protein RadC [Cellvibrionales bacterium]|nr:DNA repair protein RadC [Cellvibrionales bacterium]
MSIKIKDLPPHRRPREKLLKRGPRALDDAELLAIFLRTGAPGLSALDLAEQLIEDFGSINELLDASPEEFIKGKGLGEAKYVQLQAVMELARRHLTERLQLHDVQIEGAKYAKEYLQAEIGRKKRELFHVLFLDSQHRLLKGKTLFYGTIDTATIHPREIARRALKLNAKAAIIAHNHPSGVCEPSQADKRITEDIRKTLQLIGVKLLDHMIVADGRVMSFAEEGLLRRS